MEGIYGGVQLDARLFVSGEQLAHMDVMDDIAGDGLADIDLDHFAGDGQKRGRPITTSVPLVGPRHSEWHSLIRSAYVRRSKSASTASLSKR
jgi:hypothetical protein